MEKHIETTGRRIGFWLGKLEFCSVVFGLVVTVGVWLETRHEILSRVLGTEAIGAILVVAGVFAEAVLTIFVSRDAKHEAIISDERLKEADSRIAQSERATEEARNSTEQERIKRVQIEERILVLQKEVAGAQAKNLEMQAQFQNYLAGRKLDFKQQENIRELLRTCVPKKYKFYCSASDAYESLLLAKELSDILTSEGWELLPPTKQSSWGPFGHAVASGIVAAVAPNSDEDVRATVSCICKFLSSSGLDNTPRAAPDLTNTPEVIEFTIGDRPPFQFREPLAAPDPSLPKLPPPTVRETWERTRRPRAVNLETGEQSRL